MKTLGSLIVATLIVFPMTPPPTTAAQDPPHPVEAQLLQIVGDWEGTLDAGTARLRLIVHIVADKDGSLTATVDSVDQGASGLPVETTTFADGTLRLDLASLGARYEGTFDEAGGTFIGRWTQGPGSFPLNLVRGSAASTGETPPAPTPSDPISETWLGTLNAGGTKLRIGLHLTRDADGVLTATLDSIDQGATGLPVDRAVYADGELVLESAALALRLDATMNEAGTELTGSWKQRGVTLPLTLATIEETPTLIRPQEPTGPLPYLAEEVSYDNPAAGVTFAGTLTMPKTGGPFPAVLLITGSGPEDRDETVFGHRPFLVLADHLTRQGVAVLRVDDRGVGGSSAGPPGATTEDFATDALAGVAYLKRRPEVDPTKIGLVGHSEGGLIAPRAAVRSEDVAFLVLMAAPGLPGEEILHAQSAAIMRAAGVGEEAIARTHEINATTYGIVKSQSDDVEVRRLIREQFAAIPGVPMETVKRQLEQIVSPWFRFFLTYDPRPTLAEVRVPILAINGELDLQVPAEDNVTAIRKALETAGHVDHTLEILPGLNHLFQECETGSPSEYALIEQTFSPQALRLISDWILVHSSAHRHRE